MTKVIMTITKLTTYKNGNEIPPNSLLPKQNLLETRFGM